MDKEQALIILKELYKDAFFSVRTALETLIPEIKESEDERIKNWIIAKLTQTCRNATGEEDKDVVEKYHKACAWLEKQGERDKFKDVIQIGDKVTRNRDGVLVNLSQLERVAKKENLCDKCRKEQPSHSCADITELGRCVVEHESKVEPEFEDGDWVTDGIDNYLIQGKARNAYVTTTINDEVGCIVFGNAKRFHLWSIEDAKDGDIIYIKRYKTNDEWLLIFKKIEIQNSFINVYDYYAFCITSDNVYHGSTGSGCWGLLGNNCDIVCPATKEQRNLLFSKIRSTGYEWNEKEKVIVKVQKKQ